MGAVFGFLIIVAVGVLWLFLTLRPKYHDNQYQVDMFNRMVLAVCAMLCLSWYGSVYMYLTRAGIPEHRHIVGILGMVAIETVFLTLFFFLRNFWIFKSRSYRPGGIL